MEGFLNMTRFNVGSVGENCTRKSERMKGDLCLGSGRTRITVVTVVSITQLVD